jgi:NADH-quinone oxidoreductase subunit J
MLIDTVLFYIFALLVLGGGVLTITRRNAVHSAISLIVSLLGVAGLYLLQHAEFLFAVQIVLYVGGIMVLFLFVIMLVNLDQAAKERQFNGQWAIAIATMLAVAAELAYFLYRGKAAFRFAD